MENSEHRTMHRCPQCNFISQDKAIFDQQIKQVHSNLPTCPFCYIGFTNHIFLRKHIDQYHQEKTLQRVQRNNNVVQGSQNRLESKKGPCAFFPQPQGCRKGSECDFSHEQNSDGAVLKVRKLCRNGFRCSWKPSCKFIHLEDGEVMPPRLQKEQVQGFVMPNLSHPPPGYNLGSSRDFPSLQKESREKQSQSLPISQ